MARRKQSAGLLMYRRRPGRLEVFLVHPGGPFFARRDDGCWSLPKGEIDGDDDPLAVAWREFHEETGQEVATCALDGCRPGSKNTGSEDTASADTAGGDPVDGGLLDGVLLDGGLLDLGEIRLKSGKRVRAWAFEGDWPAGAELRSNTFSLEWPPLSGRRREFPEVDRGEFFDLDEARRKLFSGQAAFLDRLAGALRGTAVGEA